MNATTWTDTNMCTIAVDSSILQFYVKSNYEWDFAEKGKYEIFHCKNSRSSFQGT